MLTRGNVSSTVTILFLSVNREMKTVCVGVTGATVINIPRLKTANRHFSAPRDSLRFLCVLLNGVRTESNGFTSEAKKMGICSVQK